MVLLYVWFSCIPENFVLITKKSFQTWQPGSEGREDEEGISLGKLEFDTMIIVYTCLKTVVLFIGAQHRILNIILQGNNVCLFVWRIDE